MRLLAGHPWAWMARPPKKKDLRLGTCCNSEHADDTVVSLLIHYQTRVSEKWPVFHSLEVTCFNWFSWSTVGNPFKIIALHSACPEAMNIYEHYYCSPVTPPPKTLSPRKDEDFSNSILSKLTEELQGVGDQIQQNILGWHGEFFQPSTKSISEFSWVLMQLYLKKKFHSFSMPFASCFRSSLKKAQERSLQTPEPNFEVIIVVVLRQLIVTHGGG